MQTVAKDFYFNYLTILIDNCNVTLAYKFMF